jgi:hypothetical protein
MPENTKSLNVLSQNNYVEEGVITQGMFGRDEVL